MNILVNDKRPIHINKRMIAMYNTEQCAKFLTIAALIFSVAACGHDPGERALSGAGIGAGVGAAGTALTGGSLAGGALIGGAVGAAAGGLTSDRQIDFGKPFWE